MSYFIVWGACLSAGSNNANLDLSQFAKILLSNVVCVTASHCTFCTFKYVGTPISLGWKAAVPYERKKFSF